MAKIAVDLPSLSALLHLGPYMPKKNALPLLTVNSVFCVIRSRRIFYFSKVVCDQC